MRRERAQGEVRGPRLSELVRTGTVRDVAPNESSRLAAREVLTRPLVGVLQWTGRTTSAKHRALPALVPDRSSFTGILVTTTLWVKSVTMPTSTGPRRKIFFDQSIHS